MPATLAYGSTKSCEQDNELVADKYVLDLKDRADDILTKNRAPLDPLKAYLSETVAFDSLAKFALGRFWNTATRDQRLVFQYYFRKTMVHALASQALLLRDTKFEVLKTSPAGNDDIFVTSHVIPPEGDVSVLRWRIRFKNCQPSVVDLVKEGISMLTTKRQEFASIISRYNIERLLLMLEALAKKQEQEPNASVSVNYDMNALFRQMLLEAIKDHDNF